MRLTKQIPQISSIKEEKKNVDGFTLNKAYTYHTLWPTLMLSAQWGEYKEYEDAILNDIYKDAKLGNVDSNVGVNLKENLYESEMDFFDTSTCHAVQYLREWLKKQFIYMLKDFFDSEYWKVGTLTLDTKPLERSIVNIHESWAHVTGTGGYHQYHFHSGCSWSGIYYVRSGNSDNRGNRNLWYRSPPTTFVDVFNRYESGLNYSIKPKDGAVVFFPSYMPHEAEPYNGEGERVVIGFNLKQG